MKLYRNMIVCMIIISLISLVIGFIIEYERIGGNSHYQFYENVIMGIFASSILTLITSVIGYVREKKQFFIIFYQNVSNALSTTIDVIDSMKKHSQKFYSLIDKLKDYNDYFGIAIEENCCFFKKSEHIKLLESSITEIVKIIKTLSVLFPYIKQLKEGKISIEEYSAIFDTMTTKIDKAYTDDLTKYLKAIEEKSKKFIPNRILEHDYINDRV